MLYVTMHQTLPKLNEKISSLNIGKLKRNLINKNATQVLPHVENEQRFGIWGRGEFLLTQRKHGTIK